MKYVAQVVVVAAMVLGAAAAASAFTLEAFTETFLTGVGTNSCFQTGGTTCSDHRTFTGIRPGTLDAVANPGAGSLGVFGAVSFDPGGVARTGTTQSSALMRFTDIIISSSLPEPAPLVVAPINLDVHGTFGANAALGGADNSIATIMMSTLVEVGVQNQLRRRGAIDFFYRTFSGPGGSSTVQEGFSRSGDFTGNTISPGTSSFPFRSLEFAMPVGQPFDVFVFLRGDVSVEIAGQVSADAMLDFDSTAAFPALGPIFGLPAGYTVNSTQALIQDNRWIGGVAATVPEPTTLTLLAVGLAAGLFTTSRGRSRSGGTDSTRSL